MRQLVPPLNPLHVFAVATRLGNFTRAAEELGVTQSAVSRQIATLEAFFNLSLFHRERSGLVLTSAGRAYYEEIGPALDMIVAATGKLRKTERGKPLHVTVYPTFAMKWLIPRLNDFNALHPRIAIEVKTSIEPVDFGRSSTDLAIQLAPAVGARKPHRMLFADMIQPVCSPAMARQHRFRHLEELSRHTLLHSHYRRRDWGSWLTARGATAIPAAEMEFPSSILTYQAATDGLGIAIGQVALLGQDLSSRRLVGIFGPPMVQDLAYYAFWSPGRQPDARLRAFIDWLSSQARVGDPACNHGGTAAG